MGGIVSGLVEMGSAEPQKNAELAANDREWRRRIMAANTGTLQARDAGDFQQSQVRQAGSQLAAEQAAAYSDSGVDSSVGTAAQVQANTQMRAEFDAQQAKNNAAREVWGFKQQKLQAAEDHKAQEGNIYAKRNATLLGGLGKFGSGLATLGAAG